MKNRAYILGALSANLAMMGALKRVAETTREMSPDDPGYQEAKAIERDRAEQAARAREALRREGTDVRRQKTKPGTRYDGETLRALRAQRGCGRPPKKTCP